MTARRLPFRLCLVTDRKRCGGSEGLLGKVRAALRGGVDAVQLREKDLDGGELFELARRLLEECRARGALLFVNDRIDVALAVGADGIHLPARSFPVPEARRLVGPERWIGISTHSESEVRAAARDGADFAVLGPVYPTPGKGPPLGTEPLRLACRDSGIPVLAIGGILPSRVSEVLAAGARGVAVIGAVLDRDDPERAASELRKALSSSAAPGSDARRRERADP
ncbi:MAG: putative thiamine-phosphate synthase [Candidatus Binatia bacterium]|nr:MAG: putative thiamine-phosphate synthase [Candidatus Binatia bacterium]